MEPVGFTGAWMEEANQSFSLRLMIVKRLLTLPN
jgi:hypothetical protein